ncbi:MAG TPA: HEAT repeat domain-containing protein, partial [Tepidiformaceae bacterium]|nr:HEAT repeat domain-containing protein [Tepidiformaceae bacterium]
MANDGERPDWDAAAVMRAYEELDEIRTWNEVLTPRQWDRVFGKLVRLTMTDASVPSPQGHRRPPVSDLAIRALAAALHDEARQRFDRRRPRWRTLAHRLDPIFAALERRETVRRGAIAKFGHEIPLLSYYDRHRHSILEWLDGLRAKGFDEAALLIGEMQLRRWGWDWEEASSALIDLLDHPSDEVRAHAAEALGRLFDWETPEGALAEAFDLIKTKEIARPGIAEGFWSGVQGP